VREIYVAGAARRQARLAEAPAPVRRVVRAHPSVLRKLLPQQVCPHPRDVRRRCLTAVPRQDAQGIGRGIVGIFEHVGVGQAQHTVLVDVAADKRQRPLDVCLRRWAERVRYRQERVQHKRRPRLPAPEQPVRGAVPAAVFALLCPQVRARRCQPLLGFTTRRRALQEQQAQCDGVWTSVHARRPYRRPHLPTYRQTRPARSAVIVRMTAAVQKTGLVMQW